MNNSNPMRQGSEEVAVRHVGHEWSLFCVFVFTLSR